MSTRGFAQDAFSVGRNGQLYHWSNSPYFNNMSGTDANTPQRKTQGKKTLILISNNTFGEYADYFTNMYYNLLKNNYEYDQYFTIEAKRLAEITETAEEAAESSAAVDVIVFSHGWKGNHVFKSETGRERTVTPYELGSLLSPLKNKLRLFYTSACWGAQGLQEILETSGARVAVGHRGENIISLSFPFKLLKYFNRDGQNAFEAAQHAYAYALYNPNFFQYYFLTPALQRWFKDQTESGDALRDSRPVILGDSTITGNDLL